LISASLKFNRLFYLKNRWYDEKVSSLELSAPLSIMPDLSVDQTIKIMNSEGYDQLPGFRKKLDDTEDKNQKNMIISKQEQILRPAITTSAL
jgi:hypothetical protein